MRFVTVGNINHNVDYYGRIEGFKLVTELATSLGVMELTLCRKILNNSFVIEADLWQGGENLLSKITKFRASVFMTWDGKQYRIIQPSHGVGYTNNLWSELEQLISATILINE